MVFGVDFTRKFGDKVSSILNHIRIFFDTCFHERNKYVVARWEVACVYEHLLDRLVETGEFNITRGDKNAVFEDKIDGLYLEVIAEEVGVSYNGIVGLDITRWHLNLFHLFVLLDVDFEEILEYALCSVAYVQQVDPDDIGFVKTIEDIDAAAHFDFIFVFIFVEYF